MSVVVPLKKKNEEMKEEDNTTISVDYVFRICFEVSSGDCLNYND